MSDDRPFAAIQPQDGDVVAYCPHKDDVAEVLMFMLMEPLPMDECDRDDCPGEATWFASCATCAETGVAWLVGGHASWIGDEPEFRVPSEWSN